MLTDWIERHKVTPRVREIQHRQALLTYDQNAAKTLKYLQKQLDFVLIISATRSIGRLNCRRAWIRP